MEEYVWISKVVHHPVFSGRVHPILLRLAQHYNVKISIAGPEDTAAEPYVRAVHDAVQRGVAGIIVIGWGDAEMVSAVDAAVDSGIPVVCVDRDIPRSKRNAYVGSDWFRMGTAMADKMAELMGNQGRVLILAAYDSDNVGLGVMGFRQQIMHNADIEVVAPFEGPDSESRLKESVIAESLRAYPDLKGIVGFNGECGTEAARALEKAGLTGSVKLMCLEADAPQFQLVRSGAIDAALFQKSEVSTYLAFQLLYDYNHGSRATGYTPGAINIPGNVDTGFIVVTRDNIDAFESDIRLDQAVEHHQLSQQLSLISSMIENVDELAIAADSAGRIVYANSASLSFCGYPKEELVGRKIDDVFDLTSAHKSQITSCLEEEIAGHFETTAVRKDGTLFPAQVSVSPLRSDGTPRGLTIIATNISERNRSRKALIDSHVRFLTVLDSIDAHIYVADMNTHEILLVNKHMRESYGEDLVGKTCYEVFRNTPGPCSDCTNERLIDSRGNPAGPCIWEGKNRASGRWYLNCDRAIKWVDGRLVRLQIATDITRVKDLEKESLRIQAQLQQAQKMEAIGTLAGGIAHDFNNILSAVIGYTEIVLADSAEGSQQHKNLQEVLRAGNRARDLVNQILMFSRQTDRELKPVQINQIVIETLKLLRASLPTTIRIEPNLSSNAAVLADPTQIHQVMMNLCTNAAHAMRDKGGLLKIELSDVELSEEFLEQHPYLLDGSYLKLRVSDTGHGMEKKITDRIFDPFFTTKERGEGTGMGLAVVLGIVKSHGGTITVESSVGQGASFDVYLPVIDRKAGAEAMPKISMPTGNERILFVDDEKALADLGHQILKRLGYDVTTRTSSIEALELFIVQPDKFDLVITDTTMPNMTGDELARRLMAVRSDIPVILCTGYSERISKEKAYAIGIREFVLKPIVMSEMAVTVRKVLDERLQEKNALGPQSG